MVGFVKLIMYNLLSGGYQSLDNLQQDSVLGYRSQSQIWYACHKGHNEEYDDSIIIIII